MPRGGRRSGAPGKAYANRSDLSVNKGPQPVGNFADSGSYGTGTQLAAAQQAVPVSSPQPPGPTQGPPPGPGGAPGAAQGPPGPLPGELGTFHGPTDRPNEPITHGLPSGPGGGPEVLAGPVARPAQTLLQQMANSPFASDDLKALLNIASR